MKFDGLGKNVLDEQARAILLDYLTATSVTMGDGSKSTKICSLCMDKVVPSLGTDSSCVCQRTRKLIGGNP